MNKDAASRNRITTIIADIEKYLRELKELNVKNLGDLKEKKNFYSVSMVLFTIFNRLIDLAQEVVLTKSLGMPATYAEIFAILNKAGIINKRMFLALKEIVRIRNRFLHEYFAFTKNDVLQGIRKIKYVKEFMDLIKKNLIG